MSETTVRVNFGEPMPLFPLSGTQLLPHIPVPLRVFEPRYVQMVDDVLLTTKQFAMATFHGDQWLQEYHGRPALRPIVCIGHIMQHASMDDGTYWLILHGLCRARIIEELPPEEDKLYRRAMLRPLDEDEPDEIALEPYRQRITEAMENDRLADLRNAKGVLEHLKNHDIPTSVLIELLGHQFVSNEERRYRLLACDDAERRAEIVSGELMSIQRLLQKAYPQRMVETPKGCHWN